MTRNKRATACRIEIGADDCEVCAACAAVCHSFALRMRALTLELDDELCDNCSLCVYVCPTGALSLTDNVANE
ncbi:MAG: 4Fe-4S binding protein [Candidatus Latescibacterota bacterium]|nr:MAG: 4Fe-4S binding protein [Candidatus Latescibacterota bacterium]